LLQDRKLQAHFQEPGTCFPLQFLMARLRFAPPLHSGIYASIRAMDIELSGD